MTVSEMCTGESRLVPGALRGYRTWRWEPEEGPVKSRGYTWTDGRLDAVCDAGGMHGAPHQSCMCGIYGWYAPDDSRLLPGVVFGAVEASGHVLLGDFGFRAEHVRITALVTRWPPLAAWCVDNEVAVFAERAALLAEFPPDDVRDLLGREVPGPPPPGTGAHLAQQFDYAMSAVTTVVMRDVQQLRHDLTPVWEHARKQLGPALRSFVAGLVDPSS